MRKLATALFIYTLLASAALAQNFPMPPPAGVTVGGYAVVPSCGGQTLTATQAFGTMDETGKLCVSATVTASATFALTAASSLPSLSAGPGAAGYESLSGGQFTQPIFGSTIVSLSNGLPVNCVVGCAGGTTSNASSGVATSSTNGATVAYGYGFNGTTWDQLQVDGSKNLKTLAAQGGTWTVQPGNTANTTAWLVTGTGGTFPITAGSLPLPTGAATSALQTTGNTALTTINTTLGTPFQAGASIANTTFAATQATAANLNATVIGNGTFATQLTGATNNINNIAGTISLPTGAATSANQTNATQKTQIVDGGGAVIAATSNNLNVQCANCSGSGVSTADNATWTAGTSLFAGVGGTYQTTATSNPLTAGHQGFAQLTQYRAIMETMYDASGNNLTGTAYGSTPTGNALAVDAFVTNSLNALVNNADAVTAVGTVTATAGNTPVNATLYGFNGTTFDRLQVDASKYLKINCVTGCSGGAASNATSGVATSSTNGTTNSWLYGFNGTTWDQLQVDGSKYLEVNVKTATGLAQGSTTSGQTGSMTMGAVTTGNPSYTTAQTAYTSLDLNGNTRVVVYPGAAGAAGYPNGATPITASATGTTAATTATLAGTAGKTTYICGYSIRANATAATTVTNTITGVITATLSSIMWVSAAATGIGVDEQIFSPCVPASATNTGIAIVSGAPGTGGLVSSKGWGYQL